MRLLPFDKDNNFEDLNGAIVKNYCKMLLKIHILLLQNIPKSEYCDQERDPGTIMEDYNLMMMLLRESEISCSRKSHKTTHFLNFFIQVGITFSNTILPVNMFS